MAKEIARFFYVGIGFALAAIVVVLITLFLNLVWQNHHPVMAYVKPYTPFTVTDLAVESYFEGRKLRECGRIADSEIGYYKSKGRMHETTLTYINDNSPKSSFPKGVMNIGGIRWDKPVGVVVEEVGFTISHDCEGELVSSVFWFEAE